MLDVNKKGYVEYTIHQAIIKEHYKDGLWQGALIGIVCTCVVVCFVILFAI